MELGNFLGKLKGQDKAPVKNFLALVLTDEIVQSSVWCVMDGQTEIVAIGTPVEWDGDTGTTSELITAVDATISSATEGIELEPSEVILGVPHSWTDKSGILGVKKEFISKIRKELELTAIGYVVISDSVLSYLKMQEGTPTTSILIQVSRDELTLLLVRLGHIENVETIARTDDVIEDVIEGISRFKAEGNLPSRIILFNSMHDLSEIIQSLLSVEWLAQFHFLHTPKIESLPKDVAIRALSVAGGSEVAKSLGMDVTKTQVSAVAEVEPETEEVVNVDPMETDSVESTQVVEPVEDVPELLTAEEIGFTTSTIDKDEKVSKVEEEEPELEPVAKPVTVKKSMSMPSIHLPKIKLPHFKLSMPNIGKSWWLIAGVLALVAGLLFYLIWVMPRAVITVSVIPKTLDENVELTLSTTDSDIDFADKIVPAQIETITESGQSMSESTGKKTIGDPAVGEVTIYNRTSSPKTFAKGATLSSGSIKFTLDSDVTVASKSAGSDYIDVPGKANVAITAAAIGSASNLSGGTELTVQNFGRDSYVAKNDSALKGGTSEEVRVVSKEDQTELVKSLTVELLDKLRSNALAKSVPGTGVYVIEESASVDEVEYSAKVGEVAESLTATLTLKATLLNYATQDVTTLVNSAIDQAVPQGFVRANIPSTVDLAASSVSEDEKTVKGTAKVRVSLLPVIDQSRLLSLLKGKRAQELEAILSQTIPGYQSTLVQITPAFIPTKLKAIPLNPSNIKLNVAPATQ